MSWYAIRLKPNAQRPSKKDTRFSNVEFAVIREGFEIYMPLERKEIIHHRTKKPIDKWYPLIPGYAFVVGPCNWPKLEDCDFVAGILGIRGAPAPLKQSIIDIIKAAEAKADDLYELQKAYNRREKREREEHVPQRKLRVMYPSGSTITIDGSHSMLAGMRARVVDSTGRHTLKVIIETLNGMVNAELPVSFANKVA